ncbi:MAG: ankyrin repeat domain-containing protein [Burkholderiaceae bacterium]|nr:ankyrin repeat domain-containing protein [Burkholderiaceae bacterium]
MLYSVLCAGSQHVLRLFLLLFALISCAPIAVADDAGDFFFTIERNNGYMLGTMLARGVDPNLKEPKRGDPGLVLALREHAMKSFAVLLNAPKIDLEAQSNNGDTALMIASYTGNLDAVTALLDKDAEVNRPGWTALHYAATIGDCAIVKLLLDRFAYIDAESPNKTTPIMMAARSGQRAAVKLLMEEGADISLKNEQGLSATDFAIKGGYREIAEMLQSKKH